VFAGWPFAGVLPFSGIAFPLSVSPQATCKVSFSAAVTSSVIKAYETDGSRAAVCVSDQRHLFGPAPPHPHRQPIGLMCSSPILLAIAVAELLASQREQHRVVFFLISMVMSVASIMEPSTKCAITH
jgi:hypothetical protein